MAGSKHSSEHADRVDEPSDKSPFTILDEVEAEGEVSFADISDETEAEISKEMQETEGDEGETGLKADKADDTEAEASEDEDTDEAAETEEETDETEQEEEDSEEKPKADLPEWLETKLKEANPDLDMSNEEDVQKTLDDLSSYRDEAEKVKKDLEQEKEANKAFYDLLEGSDELREVSRFMYKHNVNFDEAVAALEIEPAVNLEKLKKDDPDAYLELMEKKKKQEEQRAQQEEKSKTRKETFDKNAEKSAENTEAFKKEAEIDDKQFNEITQAINPEIDKLADGLVTKDFLNIVHRGLTYEQEVDKAYQKGLTEGKNKKIEELQNRKSGDNLPRIDSSSTKQAEKDDEDIFSKALKPEPRISEI